MSHPGNGQNILRIHLSGLVSLMNALFLSIVSHVSPGRPTIQLVFTSRPDSFAIRTALLLSSTVVPFLINFNTLSSATSTPRPSSSHPLSRRATHISGSSRSHLVWVL